VKPLHGGNVHAYRRAHGLCPLDFSANINPLGLPPEVRKAAAAAIEASVHYPDPECRDLREAIALHERLPAEWVLCGNGAADLIYRFAYAVSPQTALVCAPSFAEYARALHAAKCRTVVHRLTPESGFRVTEAILPALKEAQALCLCNPNNPTGRTVAPQVLTRVLSACADRGVHVLLDECFIDFLPEPSAHTRVPQLARDPRTVILKAFTKFYALPGLRLGYALCADAALLSRMAAAGPPWSVSSVAQAAGAAALCAPEYAKSSRALIQEERAFLAQGLAGLGLEPIGEANFLLVKTRAGVADALSRDGILVRDCANFEGLCEGWIRVAIRTRAENERLLSCLGRYQHG